MTQVVIVNSPGPQGPVGPQGLQGLTGSMAESNSGSFSITGSLTVSGSSTFTNIGPAVFSGSTTFAGNQTTSGSFIVYGSDSSTPPIWVSGSNIGDGVGAFRADSTEPDIYLNDTDGGYSTVTFASQDDAKVAFGRDGNDDFYITRATESVWWDDTFVLSRQTGKLYLGYGLEVVGGITGSISGSITGSANLNSLTASSAVISGNVTVLGTASINTLIVNQTQLSTGSNQLGDAANDTQTLYGTVRIPTGSFTVSGSSYFTGSLSLGTGTVLYGDTTNPSLTLDQTTGTYLKYGTTSDIALLGSITRLKAASTVQLQTGATTHLIVSSSGNVGIGLTTPDGRLHVYESGLSSYKTYTATNAGIIITSYQSQASPYTKTADIVAASDSTTPSEIRFFTRTSGSSTISERLRIDSSGSVGIGVTSPSSKLQVAGDIRIQNETGLITDYGPLIGRYNTSQVYVGTGGSYSVVKIARADDGALNVLTNGNTGLGTASPGAKLQIKGAGSTSATTALLVQNSNTSASLSVLDNGYVGIGTTAPLRQLYVLGDLEVTNGIYGDATDHTFYTIASGSFHHRFYSRTSGGASLERFTIEGGSDTANTYFQNTNVGIGTTAPSAKLEIRATGSNETTQRWLDNSGNLLGDFAEFGDAGVLRLGYVISSLSTNRPLLTLDGGGSNTTAAIYLRSKSGTNNIRIASDLPSYISGSNLAVGFTSPTASAILHISGAAADNVFRVDTPAAPYALFVSGSGNVGIGTTTTAANLEIKGSATALQLTTSDYVLGASGSRTIIGFGASTGNTYSRIQTTDVGGISASDLVLQADSGNVGIGTSSPSTKLHVKDTTNTIVNAEAGSSTYAGILQTVGSNTWRLIAQGSGASGRLDIKDESYGVTAMSFPVNSGNVGIGTNAPVSKLQVTGNGATYGEAITWTGGVDYGGANRGYLGYDAAGATTAYIGNEFIGGDATSARFQIRMGTSPKLTVMSGGNVGIGTITPSASLHISGSSGSVLLEVDSNSQQNILYVSGSGNVGIGTSTPGFKLDVNGSVSGTSLNSNFAVISTRASKADFYGFTGPTLSYYNGVSVVPALTVNSTGNVVINTTTDPGAKLAIRGAGATSATTALLVQNSNASASLAVLDNGNVGIGTTSPSEKLHTVGNIKAEQTSNSNAILTLNPNSGTIGTNYQWNLVGVNSAISYAFQIREGSTPYIHITNTAGGTGGNVGIGTTSPQYKLDLSGSLRMPNNTGLYMNSSTGTPFQTFYVDSGNNLVFSATSSGDTYFYEGSNILARFVNGGQINLGGTSATSLPHLKILSSGNVGIGLGTTNPTYKLHVSGTAYIQSGSLTADHVVGNFGTANPVLTLQYATVPYAKHTVGNVWNYIISNPYAGSSSGGIELATQDITRMIVAKDGTVGIGTTSPTGSLHIRGGLGGATSLATATGNPILRLDYASNPGLGMYFGAINSGGGAYQYIQAGTSTGTIAYSLALSPYGGNVGVGTTAPAGGRLQIQGSGTTSATTALLVQNANTSASLTITDDATSRFFGNVGIGALPASGSLHISGAASTSSAAVYIYKSGSTTLDIQGSQGQLFSVTDALSGSLMSVNDISGLPILEVFSDDKVVMGSFSAPALTVTGSAVIFSTTSSAAPAYTGSDGQTVFTVIGGNAFIYVWLAGRWRSGSLA